MLRRFLLLLRCAWAFTTYLASLPPPRYTVVPTNVRDDRKKQNFGLYLRNFGPDSVGFDSVYLWTDRPSCTLVTRDTTGRLVHVKAYSINLFRSEQSIFVLDGVESSGDVELEGQTLIIKGRRTTRIDPDRTYRLYEKNGRKGEVSFGVSVMVEREGDECTVCTVYGNATDEHGNTEHTRQPLRIIPEDDRCGTAGDFPQIGEPTHSPTPPPCFDDPSWTRFNIPARDCDWVARRPQTRCTFRGTDGRIATEACLATCGCEPTTPPPSTMSPTTLAPTSSMPTTLQPTRRPTRHPTTLEPSTARPSTSIPTTATPSTSTPTSCFNDQSWAKRNEPSKDCRWVSLFAPNRCGVRGEDKRLASEACFGACGCVEPTAEPTLEPTTSARPSVGAAAPTRGDSNSNPSANSGESGKKKKNNTSRSSDVGLIVGLSVAGLAIVVLVCVMVSRLSV